MNIKLLIGVLVLVVIIGWLFTLGGKNPTPQPVGQSTTTKTITPTQAQSLPKRQDATVTVSSSGFSPLVLTIGAGTRVIWFNKSGGKISVNSDEHPTHRLYPPLNLAEVPDGSAVTLVFDKPGTYKYHDHYNPSHTGTVVVE